MQRPEQRGSTLRHPQREGEQVRRRAELSPAVSLLFFNYITINFIPFSWMQKSPTQIFKSFLMNVQKDQWAPKRDPRKDFLFHFLTLFLSFCCALLSPHNLICHFCLCVCGFRGWASCFFDDGMNSMTEMACATSPSSAFAAAAFGASSSSVRLRYQTVGPLYVNQTGWATLPQSYYALDYCSPK